MIISLSVQKQAKGSSSCDHWDFDKWTYTEFSQIFTLCRRQGAQRKKAVERLREVNPVIQLEEQIIAEPKTETSFLIPFFLIR